MAVKSTNGTADLYQKTFEHKWVIKKWQNVVEIETLTENTTTEINLKDESVLYAKVLLGTTFDGYNVALYWKLLGKHPCMDNVKFALVTEVLNSNGTVAQTIKTEANAVTKTDKKIIKSFWARTNGADNYALYVNSEGSLVMKLEFTLKNIPDVLCLSETEEFKSSLKSEFCQNFASLLDDKLSSDLTILTKNKAELVAHKLILRAQCPVFASMFGSNFLESSTGVVNVDDISAKTMKLLLNYWYTGELQTYWKDEDIVVEFTYAAGKYQMTRVLKMLNDMLGYDFKTSDVEVDLLKMAQQLHLKNAEARITKRIINRIAQAERGTEILSLFSLATDSLDEDSFGASKIFKAWNNAMSESDDPAASNEDVKLMALACKVGMKNIENKLLKLIVGTVVKMDSANELFALFDDVKTEELDQGDLLVRVNP